MTLQQQLDTGTSHLLNGSDPADQKIFKLIIKGHSIQGRRPMPWRDLITPYRVVVSELMLQQTQVPRVMEKFPQFIQRFPDFATLSQASLADILEAWQGLGYNRRAKYLHAISRQIIEEWKGDLPRDPETLITLPGIGRATAGSISAFAFNQPVVFIETNIRRVFIHHFFTQEDIVADADIIPLVEKTLDHMNPREWYYALMDYGTWLAGRTENPTRRSRHYAKQSTFEGSDRQIRGQLLKRLLTEKRCSPEVLITDFQGDPSRVRRILLAMIQEGLLCVSEGSISIEK